MELRVAVIVDENVRQMKRLEETIHLFGIHVICFKFTNLVDANEFIFSRTKPIDYLLLDVDTVLPEEKCLRMLPWMRVESDVVIAGYSPTDVEGVAEIKKRLSADLVITLPMDDCGSVPWVGYILVFNEMKD